MVLYMMVCLIMMPLVVEVYLDTWMEIFMKDSLEMEWDTGKDYTSIEMVMCMRVIG